MLRHTQTSNNIKTIVMKLLFLTITLLLNLSVNAGIIQGKIGHYSIMMEIEEVNWETGDFIGRYKYAHKNSYLSLRGIVKKQTIWIEEQYKNEISGHFFLSIEDDTIKGKWISGKEMLDVQLYTKAEDLKDLETKSLSDYQKNVSNGLSGGYAVENYFINYVGYEENNPQLEIGFNGGTLILQRERDNKLRFSLYVICGQSYHIASVDGVARKIKDGSYVYHSGPDLLTACSIYFEVKEKEVYVRAENYDYCMFGNAAYLNHTFKKITDRVDFNQEISVQKLKD